MQIIQRIPSIVFAKNAKFNYNYDNCQNSLKPTRPNPLNLCVVQSYDETVDLSVEP